MLERLRRYIAYGLVYIISPSLYDKIKARVMSINEMPRPFTNMLVKYGKNKVPPLKGAEVGAFSGKNAKDILQRVNCLKLYVIDIEEHRELRPRLHNFLPDAEIMIMDSYEASKKIDDLSLDFVYIDADHSYDSVWGDLESWFPKVKMGGYIGGHDMCNLIPVTQAVIDWCHIYQKSVKIDYPDWWIKK